MRLPIFQIDAFTDSVFGGNPAAICPLDDWLPAERMQAVAAENNLSETAFFVPEDDGFALRWFTPTVEVDLCGHATLAAGWLVLTRMWPERKSVRFATRSGVLEVVRDGTRLALDFPSLPAELVEALAALVEGIGRAPDEVRRATNYLAVFATESDIRAIEPNMADLATLHPCGIIVTAPGADDGVDFVSRYFAPAHGVPEDPVTGSAHCTLTPYWSARLGRKALTARQVSARGGALWCEDRGDRVRIAGNAVLYLEGAIEI
jgi:PhzF family phenazine biosynthesis protein